ncbi:MAG: hypothetical protein ACJ73S_06945 [Mycobacteriales bacterium]|jgi:hypothetical protein
MAPVLLELSTRPPEPEPAVAAEQLEEVVFVGDLDEIVETTMCSCNAGDDNPY